MENKTSHTRLYTISETVDQIYFCLVLKDGSDACEQIKEFEVFIKEGTRDARVNWKSSHVDSEFTKDQMDLLAGAAGAIIESNSPLIGMGA